MLCIIQARSNSRRFKNKALHLIYGIPLIQHVVNRARKSKEISKLIVSSSYKKSDDQLISYLKKNKINFFRGNLENVALRLYETAKVNKAKFTLKISLRNFNLYLLLSLVTDFSKLDNCLEIALNSIVKLDCISEIFLMFSSPKFFNIDEIVTK